LLYGLDSSRNIGAKDMSGSTYEIIYEFRFTNNIKKHFKIQLDFKTLSINFAEPVIKYGWMQLENEQCGCCPLSCEDYPYCPVAINIGNLTEAFKNMVSYEKCLVLCTTMERTYLKKTSLMEGLASIFGIIIATSDCPIMTLFKPMARFHLPFSTTQETVFRAASIYMLRQYFNHKKNLQPDMDMKFLDEHYNKVRMVNRGLISRLNTVNTNDADKNAVNILFSISQILSREINFNLNSVEHLFDNHESIPAT
jgi:hypothetical protein